MALLKYFLAVCIVAVVVASDSKQQICTPNAMFHVECNTCMCSQDGTGAACTRMYCPPEMTITTEDMCTPNSRFMNYCNNCQCSEDGRRQFCTKKLCDKSSVNLDGTRFA